ncbi:uncharacterized protein LOC127138066 [Lathyrus oleraceus]|uniref:uncharacterized protein LOC127138066 n=1 Tax=Pisum sativum TaxID=3888 RepID=UPI0021CFEB81|nr:uncharacterized protein LOC127138066 [Pisum sativum]
MDKLVNEMKSNGDDIKEKDVVEKIMRIFSTRFDYVVAAIEEGKDVTTMTLNDLQASLESREMRMHERSSDTFEQALKSQTNVRNEGLVQRRANHFQRGHSSKDTGCSNHLSGNKELFSNLDQSFCSIVKLSDNSKLQVLGKGKISIRLKDGSLNYISDIFYVPSICQNLLSIEQLAEKGYDLNFNKRGCTINDVEICLIEKTSMSRNCLFPMKIKYDANMCYKVVAIDDNWFWHMRLRHFNL